MRIFAALIIFSCLFLEACKCNKEQPESRPLNNRDQLLFDAVANDKAWLFYRDSLEGSGTLAPQIERVDTFKLSDSQSGIPLEGQSSSSCYPFYFKTVVRNLSKIPGAKDPDTYYIRPAQIYGGGETSSFSVIIAQNLYFRLDTLVSKPINLITGQGLLFDSVYVLTANYPISTGRDQFPDSVYYQRRAGLIRFCYRTGSNSFIRWNRKF